MMGQDIERKSKQKKGGIATVIISSKVNFVAKSINRDKESDKSSWLQFQHVCGGGEAFSHQQGIPGCQ